MSGGGFKRSDGITAVTWCLAAFTFVQIYSSCLTSYTSLVFQRPGVVTFENLATSRRHEVFTVKYTFAERLFLVKYQNHPISRIFYHLSIGWNHITGSKFWDDERNWGQTAQLW